MQNVGLSESEAKRIEANYHDLYKVSDQWVDQRIQQASKDGYVDLAFGLRLRTPMLSQVILDSSTVPYEAQKEARTAGNALGQSYGMLNNRSAIATMNRVINSPYVDRIFPIMHIHDSQYFMVEDDIDLVHWFNKVLIEEMSWQDLPELEHPTVRLGASLDIFWPHTGESVTLPNNASPEAIRELTEAHKKKIKEKG